MSLNNISARHSREGGNPAVKIFREVGQSQLAWIPAFAGMTGFALLR
jgi:hypothetical protein